MARRNVDMVYAAAPFAGGVGHRVMDPVLHADLVRVILTLCDWRRARAEFPGSNPVSLSRVALDELARRIVAREYLVADKTDGVRYLWVALRVRTDLPGDAAMRPMALMMDRAMRLTVVPMKDYGDDGAAHHQYYDGTVIDGELVRARDGGWRFLAFDAQAIGGATLVHEPYAERYRRLAMLFDGAAAPCVAPDVLTMSVKQQYSASDLHSFGTTIAPELPYATDGFVFTPLHTAMRMGRDDALIKWKRDGAHTVDLALVVQRGASTYALMMMGDDGAPTPVCADLALSDDQLRACGIAGADVQALPQPVIVECAHVGAVDHRLATRHERRYGVWCPVKLRADKDAPNHSYTLVKTVDNIREAIHFESIVAAIVLAAAAALAGR